jgi:tRNA wybutosine-synthesizing protein 3
MRWKEKKGNILKRLNEKVREGLVDERIIPTLDRINKFSYLYTVSSCSGRVIVIDLPKIGDKRNARFTGRWHKKIEKKEVLNAIERCEREGWLILNPPIIHAVSKDIEHAKELLRIAIESGFKRSGIKSIIENKITVEINSTEVIETIVAKDGINIIDDDYLDVLIECANIKFERSQRKIERLNERLDEIYIYI